MVGARRSPEEHWNWDEREAARAYLGGASGAIPNCQVIYLPHLRSRQLLVKGALCALSVLILNLHQWTYRRRAWFLSSYIERLRRQEFLRSERTVAQPGWATGRADPHEHRSDR